MIDYKIVSKIHETSALILKFEAAIVETKERYRDKPKYLASSVAQTQNQIQKLVEGLKSLVPLIQK